MNIGGIDIGTSGVKCAVYNEEGKCIGFSRKVYSYLEKSRGYCLDPNQVWQRTKEALKEVAGQCKGEIDGISISSIGEACILMDDRDRVLYPSILYNDKRGIDESNDYIKKFGQKKIYTCCGIASNGTYSVEKLKWIFSHEKHLEKIDKIFLYEDYIIYCLTGQRNISYSLASRTMAFNITEKKWIPEFLEFAGVHTENMSEPVNSGTEAGAIKDSLMKELGIKRKMKVFTGGHDHLCCTLGAGMILGEGGVNISGSGDTVSFIMKNPVINEKMQEGGYSCSPYTEKNLYSTYGLCAMSGTLLRWYREFFGQNQRNFYQEIDNKISKIKSNIVLLPGFTIMGTPDFRLNSTGLMDGFTLKTSPDELYLGILEGVAFHLKMNLEFLKKENIENSQMYVVGGGANSNIWNRIKADIWNKKIIQIQNQEAGTAGCAMLSGVGLKIYKDCKEASLKFVRPIKYYFPENKKREEYEEKYQRFLKLYKYKKERMEEEDAGQ